MYSHVVSVYRSISVILLLILSACQITPTERVLKPEDDMLAMCLQGTRTSSAGSDGVDISCDLNPVRIDFVLTNPDPGATLAKIKCQATDVDGKLVISTCTCQADAISGCDGFAQRCKDRGHEELGGGPEFSICHINPG